MHAMRLVINNCFIASSSDFILAIHYGLFPKKPLDGKRYEKVVKFRLQLPRMSLEIYIFLYIFYMSVVQTILTTLHRRSFNTTNPPYSLAPPLLIGRSFVFMRNVITSRVHVPTSTCTHCRISYWLFHTHYYF